MMKINKATTTKRTSTTQQQHHQQLQQQQQQQQQEEAKQAELCAVADKHVMGVVVVEDRLYNNKWDCRVHVQRISALSYCLFNSNKQINKQTTKQTNKNTRRPRIIVNFFGSTTTSNRKFPVLRPRVIVNFLSYDHE